MFTFVLSLSLLLQAEVWICPELAALVNPNSIDKVVSSKYLTMRLIRRAKDVLQRIRARSPSQSNSRLPTAESSGTVHHQGISTNHFPWIEIDLLVKLVISCRCLNVRSHRQNVVVSLLYDLLQSDSHCALQVTTARVNWMEQFGTIKVRKFWVSFYLIVGLPSDTHCALQVQLHETTQME